MKKLGLGWSAGLAVLLASLLAGCGGSAKSAPEAQVQAQPTAAAPAAAPAQPAPTATATAAPPRPTAAPPTATPQPSGIGVSRSAIQSVFENPGIGFTFKESALANGQPRVIGESKSKQAMLELSGPANNLTNASMMLGVTNQTPEVVKDNAIYMAGFLKLAAPKWESGHAWVSANLQKAAADGAASTTYEGIRAEIRSQKELGMLIISITPNR